MSSRWARLNAHSPQGPVVPAKDAGLRAATPGSRGVASENPQVALPRLDSNQQPFGLSDALFVRRLVSGHSRGARHRDSSEGPGSDDQARAEDQSRIPYARTPVMGGRDAHAASAGQAGSDGVCSVVGGLRDRDNAIGDLRNAFNAAGFEWVTSHTFRRTVATLMDQSGLSARAAADQLGHSHPSLTQDVYYGLRIASTGAADVLEVLG